MSLIQTRNNRVVSREDIPLLPIDQFSDFLTHELNYGKRPVMFFGLPFEDRTTDEVIVYSIMAHDESSSLSITSCLMKRGESYPSLTQRCPAFHIFERELFEQFGITPIGHPWLKPVRFDYRRLDESSNIINYPFFHMEGEELHEVAVGPVHAGIIEPGHFRFMCHGERVHHLEIQLGYQHRGVESLFEFNGKKGGRQIPIQLAESIAGDSVIAHASACAQAIESLCHCDIPLRAAAIRGIALELERIGVHIGDLGAIANDIAYLTGNAVFGATRTLVINTSLAICGSRFGRGWIRFGGVLFDIDESLRNRIRATLEKVEHDVVLMGETMFSSPNVLTRLEKTGILEHQKAKDIGMVGMAARASGVQLDVRSDHSYGIYKNFPIYKITLESGDVFARAYIRYIEIRKSIAFIYELLDNLPQGIIMKPIEMPLSPNSMTVSMVEGWRGETVHALITDKEGNITRYKIKDPSFHNWFGLALAVRENGVSDFPLVNKSFNLSYCGNDL